MSGGPPPCSEDCAEESRGLPSEAMKNLTLLIFSLMLAVNAMAQSRAPISGPKDVYPVAQGFVDANGVLIYYEALGKGEPLMIVHGGPGASHDYFLPYLLPLARDNRLIFIDERGSGRSQKLNDPSGYTVENMVE